MLENQTGLTAFEILVSVLIISAGVLVMLWIGRDMIWVLADISARSKLDPEDTGEVPEEDIAKKTIKIHKEFVEMIKAAFAFIPFVMVLVIWAFLWKGLDKYPHRVARAVRRYWAS